MKKMETTAVELEILEQGKIALVRFNRPDALNALNNQLAEDFGKVVDQLGKDKKVRAVILTGKGRAFCAGGDLAKFKAAPDPKQFLHKLAEIIHQSIVKLRAMNAPWIAAINGPCFGVGLSLACCCDLRMASANAKFSVAFSGVGLAPDSSLLYYLPRIVGLPKATEMTLLNAVLSAEEAFKIDLVSKVVEPEKLLEESLEIAKRLAGMPTLALGMDKKMLDASFCDTLEEHLDLELEYVTKAAGTADFQEGCQAFFERRKPNFKGS
jgi:2-(1,2-epoxy-1,2-dihydrophenyl)acetyl-CoA isomerase